MDLKKVFSAGALAVAISFAGLALATSSCHSSPSTAQPAAEKAGTCGGDKTKEGEAKPKEAKSDGSSDAKATE